MKDGLEKVGHVFTGRVVSVHDGDTITVLDGSKNQWKIRLKGIDAPEEEQAYGEAAKKALSGMIFGQDVTIDVYDTDRYGRSVADVRCMGHWVNMEMVQEGWAWHYTEYSRSADLAAAEESSKGNRLGLWNDTYPIPPWTFRKDLHERTSEHSKAER